jgi:DNA-binding transcriptional ArsR family regulator
MIVHLGIDDTDNVESRGTGYQARRLGEALAAEGLAELRAVTRHQLLVDPRISYTSKNSAVCLVLEASADGLSSVVDFVSADLRSHSAPGADAGIAIAPRQQVGEEVTEFGRATKLEPQSLSVAYELAKRTGMIAAGLTGSGAGVIGALAAVGLHQSGGDGRFIWLPGLRSLSGTYRARELTRRLGVELQTSSGAVVPLDAEITLDDWVRPVLREGRAILLAEREGQYGQYRWKLIDKSGVKALSN